MISEKEKQIVWYYVKNMLTSGTAPEYGACFCDLLENNSEELFGIKLDTMWKGSIKYKKKLEILHKILSFKQPDLLNVNPKVAFSIIDAMCKIQTDINDKNYDKNFQIICDTFELPDFCRPYLYCFVNIHSITLLRNFIKEYASASIMVSFLDDDYIDIYKILCDRQTDDEEFFSKNNPLIETGIVVNKYKTDSDYVISPKMIKLFKQHFNTVHDVRKALVSEPLATDLCKYDFEYIQNDFDSVANILKSAIEHQNKGVNILLYGKPGGGKTEFAKTVVKHIGLNLFSTSDSKTEKEYRFSDLAQIQRILKSDTNSVILFDEAEDAFSFDRFNHKSPSKLYINHRLEQNSTPVIWITNDIHNMDDAYIRRFTVAIKIEEPDNKAKNNIWHRICKKYNVSMNNSEISKMVKQYNDIPIALIDTAIKNAKLTNDTKIITYTLDNLSKALTGKEPSKTNTDEIKFDTKLLNTDTNLQFLAEQIKQKNIQRFSLCLYGAPGTGKTAYAQYLANILDMPILKKRVSDIQSMWVGETEKNIASAFSEARKKKALLVFDEADSFLRDRNLAEYSWETNSVNEMLTQMESAEYPFVCTTNLMIKLDRAALRRFTFKIKYDFLTLEQVILAFKDFFDMDITENDVKHLTHLAPGDFSVIKKKAELLNITNKNELLDMLSQEQNVKGIKRTTIGFNN